MVELGYGWMRVRLALATETLGGCEWGYLNWYLEAVAK